MNFEARARAGRLLAAVMATIAVVGVNAQKADSRKDPLGGYYFEVELGEQKTAHFRSVGGLKIETEVIEYQEGGANGVIRKLAGPTRYANIRLSRPFTGDRALYDWYISAQKPQPIRIDGSIRMFDRQGTLVATWKFKNGFPAKWELSELDASKNEVSIETIEIAHEGLEAS